MKPAVRKALYGVLAILMILDFYSIFNAGNPNSLFRPLIKDPSWDFTVTVVISLIIAIISLTMAQDSNRNSIKNLLYKNIEFIKQLRKENRSEEEIAESFVTELKFRKKFIRSIVKRRVLRFLAKIE
ncbi:MAG: hypothetical protein ISR78_06045 [Spirochaetia bacterium]|nr:hypothetical protein [Spirochaetia bacterium]